MRSAFVQRISPILLLTFFGCTSVPSASSPSALPSTTTQAAPAIKVEQLPTSDMVIKQGAAISIAYQMTIKNPTAEPIRLRKLEMKTMGRSPYQLREEVLDFDEVIEPGKEAVVAFSMWALPRESNRDERVWVQGTVTFEGTMEAFQTKFTQSFDQPK